MYQTQNLSLLALKKNPRHNRVGLVMNPKEKWGVFHQYVLYSHMAKHRHRYQTPNSRVLAQD